MENIIRRLSILFIIILIFVTAFTPYANGPAIRADGYGYSTWARKITNFDINICSDDHLHRLGAIAISNEERTKCVVKYFPGVGIFQAPFFAIFNSKESPKKFTSEQHLIVLIIGASLLFLSSLLIYKTALNLSIPQEISFISLIAFLFGGGLFHYGTYEASYSHIYSVFGCSLGLFLLKKIKNRDASNLHILTLSIISVWLNLVRITNILITFTIFFMNLDLVNNSKGNNLIITKKDLKLVGAFLISSSISFMSLGVYNFLEVGKFTLNTYGTEGNAIFNKFGDHFFDVLLSFDGGLLPYYPIFLLTLFLILFTRKSLIGYSFIFLTLTYSLIYGSWGQWTLGGGLGHRGFIDIIPFGVISLAESINKISKHKRKIIYFFIGICIYINTSIMFDYWSGDFPFDAEKEYFLKSVFRGLIP